MWRVSEDGTVIKTVPGNTGEYTTGVNLLSETESFARMVVTRDCNGTCDVVSYGRKETKETADTALTHIAFSSFRPAEADFCASHLFHLHLPVF